MASASTTDEAGAGTTNAEGGEGASAEQEIRSFSRDFVSEQAITRIVARADALHDEITADHVGVSVSDGWPRLLTQSELEQIYAVPGNEQCADCLRSAQGPDGKEARPSWASTNLLVTLSPQAAGVHRSMGVHISKVLSLTLDEWTEEQFLLMLTGGNEKINKVLEIHEASSTLKPDLQHGGDHDLEAYIRSKYIARAFCQGGAGQLVEVEKRATCPVAATEYSGIIFAKIVRAQGLPSMDVASESDPYVVLQLRGGHQTMRTTTKQNSNNPLWNETLSLNYRSLDSDILEFQVWDADVLTKDDIIGRCEFALSELIDARTPPDTGLAHTCIVDDGVEDYVQCGGCRAAGCCVLPPCLYIVKPCLVQHHKGTLSIEVSYKPLC